MTTTETAAGLTRAQMAEQVAYLEQLAAEAKTMAGTYRARLTAQAEQAYLAGEGAATWRINGLGTISTSLAQDAVAVDDEATLLAWVKANHPEWVQEVIAAGPRAALLKTIRVDAEGALVYGKGDDAQVVPGVKPVPGGQFRGLSFRFPDDTKETYAGLARDALARIQLTPEPAEPTTGEAVPWAGAKDDEDAAALAAFLG